MRVARPDDGDRGPAIGADPAQTQIDALTRPAVGVAVPQAFVPSSEIAFQLSWRNVKRIDLALYPVDLSRDVVLTNPDLHAWNWVQGIDLAGREKARSWSRETGDKGEHRQVALSIDKLPQGIWEIRYDLRAEAPGKYHGLPAVGHAMYAPEIRGNGAEIRLEVKDRPPGAVTARASGGKPKDF